MRNIFATFTGCLLVTSALLADDGAAGTTSKAQKTMTINEQLSKRQQAIIPIAAFTASGDLEKLQSSLNEGLDAGLTVNEIKEIPVHLYAYAGFPRSLNALAVFMKVLDERKARSIEDPEGKDASPVPSDLDKDEYGAKVRAKLSGLETDISGAAWQRFSPITDKFLKEHQM